MWDTSPATKKKAIHRKTLHATKTLSWHLSSFHLWLLWLITKKKKLFFAAIQSRTALKRMNLSLKAWTTLPFRLSALLFPFQHESLDAINNRSPMKKSKLWRNRKKKLIHFDTLKRFLSIRAMILKKYFYENIGTKINTNKGPERSRYSTKTCVGFPLRSRVCP